MKRLLLAALLACLIYPAFAFWQSRDSGYNIAVSGSVGPPTLTFLQRTIGSNSGNTSTFTNMNIGPASGFVTRRIIMAVLVGGELFNGGLTSVVINGSTTATQNIVCNINEGAAVVSADVPTGTTANVVVTTGSTIFGTVEISAYSVDDADLASTSPSTACGTTASGTSITSGSFTQNNGGFVIAENNLGANAGGTGTSIGAFTNDALCGSGNKECFMHLAPVGSTSTGAITSNWTTASAGELAVAAWR